MIPMTPGEIRYLIESIEDRLTAGDSHPMDPVEVIVPGPEGTAVLPVTPKLTVIQFNLGRLLWCLREVEFPRRVTQ